MSKVAITVEGLLDTDKGRVPSKTVTVVELSRDNFLCAIGAAAGS